MKMREENRNNELTEIARFDIIRPDLIGLSNGHKRAWLLVGPRLSEKLHAWELSGNQPILRFDIILQHDLPIEQCLLHIRVSFGGKTKRPFFDLLLNNEHLPKSLF